MEKAIKTAYKLACNSLSEEMAWRWLKTLGILYYAAYQNSKNCKQIVILGSIPSKVTPSSLNYTTEEVCELAIKTFSDICSSIQKSNPEQESPELKEIERILQECSDR